MSSGMVFEISTEEVDTILESDNLSLEVAENEIDVVSTLSSDTMDILIVGPQGPQGPAGASYVHTQSTPAATWTIPHNLNTILSVVILLDSAPTVPVYTDVSYPNLNTAVLTFPSAESGKAYLR